MCVCAAAQVGAAAKIANAALLMVWKSHPDSTDYYSGTACAQYLPEGGAIQRQPKFKKFPP
eukprot:2750837-Amphidinium_carterae.1